MVVFASFLWVMNAAAQTEFTLPLEAGRLTEATLKYRAFSTEPVRTEVLQGPYRFSGFPSTTLFSDVTMEFGITEGPGEAELVSRAGPPFVRMRTPGRVTFRLGAMALAGAGARITAVISAAGGLPCTREVEGIQRNVSVAIDLSCDFSVLYLRKLSERRTLVEAAFNVEVTFPNGGSVSALFVYEFQPKFIDGVRIARISPERAAVLGLGKTTVRATVEWETQEDTNLELRLYERQPGRAPQFRARSGLVPVKQGRGTQELTIADYEVKADVGEIVVVAGLAGSSIAAFFEESPEVYFGVPASTSVDLAIERVQAVQVVQDEQNSVPLIPMKSTMVRVFTRSLGPDAKRIDRVTGLLRAEGQAMELAPVNGHQAWAETTDPGYENRDQSLNFILPMDWTKAGRLKLTAEVSGYDQDSKIENNSLEFALYFDPATVPALPVLISLWDVCRKNGDPSGKDPSVQLCPGESINRAGERVHAILPVGDDRRKFVHLLLPGRFPAIQTMEDLERFGGLWAALAHIMNRAYGKNQVFRAFAAIQDRGSLVRQTAGVPAGLVLAAIIDRGIAIDCPYFSIGGQSCEEGGKDVLGAVTIASFRTDPGIAPDATSAFDGSTGVLVDPKRWISTASYLALLRRIRAEAASVAATPAKVGNREAAQVQPTLLVSGEIQRDGSAGRMDAAIRLPASTPDADDPNGDYCLVSTKASGVEQVCFPVSFSETTGLGFFAVEIPAAEDLTKVALLARNRPERELAVAQETGRAAVRFVTPAAGEVLEGTRAISWVATGPGAPDLTYTLLYSTDDGTTWLPAVVHEKTTSVDFDFGSVETGKQIRFRLVGAAGLTGATVELGPLEVRQRPRMEVAAKMLGFGTRTVGEVAQLGVRIKNAGTGLLKVTAEIPAGDPFVMAAGRRPSLELEVPGGREREVMVSFMPGSAGDYRSALRLTGAGMTELVELQGSAYRNSQPSIEVAGQLDFGSVEAGKAKEMRLAIRNAGKAELVVQGIRSTSRVFSVAGDGSPLKIPPGEAPVVVVRGMSAMARKESAVLKVTSSDPSRPLVDVAVTLDATVAGAAVEVAPLRLEFGNVGVNATRDLPLTVSNRGGAALTVTGISSSNARFRVETAMPLTIAAGAQAAVNVRFAPVAAGGQTGTLTVASNGVVGAVTVDVAGTGVAPAGAPAIQVSPASLDFGTVNVGGARDLPVVVANGGTAALSVTSVAISNARFAVVSGGAPFTVAAGGRATVNVRFSPNAAGVQTGTLVVASNDATRRTVTISISGTGGAETAASPMVEVSPGSLGYGNVNVGATKELGLTVANRGTAALQLSGMVLSNPRFTIVSGGAPLTVAAGGQATVNVRFAPNAAGGQSGSLVLTTNDPARTTVTVGLAGTGVAVAAEPLVLQVDDGSFERAVGASGADISFVNRLTPTRYPATLRAVRIYFPARADGLAEGYSIQILSGGNPSGGTNINPPNVSLQSGTAPSGPQGRFTDYLVPPVTISSGDFVVGFRLVNPAGVFPMANDTSSAYRGRSYLGTGGGNLQLVDSIAGVTPGNFLIRAVVE